MDMAINKGLCLYKHKAAIEIRKVTWIPGCYLVLKSSSHPASCYHRTHSKQTQSRAHVTFVNESFFLLGWDRLSSIWWPSTTGRVLWMPLFLGCVCVSSSVTHLREQQPHTGSPCVWACSLGFLVPDSIDFDHVVQISSCSSCSFPLRSQYSFLGQILWNHVNTTISFLIIHFPFY